MLYADYSDPDAIRVGDDFWLTASSFGHVPGLPILHSRDLVNWTLVNHALPRLDHAALHGLAAANHFSTPRHGAGIWAPSIRYHAGKFWIYFPDPDFGLFVTAARDPRGEWSPPALVKAGKGLIDPCPFWDEDGSGYLIHGWAKSRSGIKNRLTLHRLRADHLGIADDGVVIIDGDHLPGWHTIEGPKLYRRDGFYYVFAPAGGVADGYQAVFRAQSLYGPFENRIVLVRGRTNVNGPHQGAWVDSPDGSDWFLHFQELPAYGRVVHLQPMRWHDGWPVMGADIDGDGIGEPVATAAKPLQSDATVSYANKVSGEIWTTQAMRNNASPYNTYQHTGLPPGPIGNPGETTLKAALNPATGTWLYWIVVNLKTGKTVFSNTLAEHNAAKQQFIEYCKTSDAC